MGNFKIPGTEEAVLTGVESSMPLPSTEKTKKSSRGHKKNKTAKDPTSPPNKDQTKPKPTNPSDPVLSGPTSPISPVPPLTTQPSPTPTIPSFDIPSISKGLHSLLAEPKIPPQPNPMSATLDDDEEKPDALTENEVGINELIEKINKNLEASQRESETIDPITSEMTKPEKEGILNAITSLIEKELTEIAILKDSMSEEKRVTALIELKNSIHNLLSKESIKLNDALIEVAKASAKDEKKAGRFDSLTQHFWSQPYKVSKGKLGENEYSHTCNNLNGGARSLIEAYLRDKGRPKGNRLKIIVNKSPNATSYSKQEKEFMGSAIDNSLLYALKPPRLVGIQSDNKEANITPREMGQDIHMKLYIAGFHFNEDGSQKDLGVLQRIIALRVLEREHEELAARYTLAQAPSSKAGTSKPLAAISSANDTSSLLGRNPVSSLGEGIELSEMKQPHSTLQFAVESIAGKAAVELLKFEHMSEEEKEEFGAVKDMLTTGYLESFKGTNMDADEIMDMLSESTRIKNMEIASRSNLRDYLSHIIASNLEIQKAKLFA